MPQAICTPAATQKNPDICPPSHSSTDYADMVDPFLSREQDEFRETEEEEASDEHCENYGVSKQFLS